MSHDHEHHTEEDLKQELEHHDEWFRHSADEPSHMEAHGTINSVFIIGYLALTIAIVFIIAVGVLQYVKSSQRELRTVTEDAIPRGRYFGPGTGETATQAVAGWQKELGEWAWVEQGSVAQIPIDVAMDRVVEQYNN